MTPSDPRPAGRLRCLLVDPSLFTGPYDAALDAGLHEAGVDTTWATRPVRPQQERELPAERADEFFYRRVDDLPGWPAALRALVKGAAHAVGLLALLWRVWVSSRPQVVHFQWAVLPLLDAVAMVLMRPRCPVVLTVHDPVAYNGERMSLAQRVGFHLPLAAASRLVVHTPSGRESLISQGVDPIKIEVIPHGPLALKAQPRDDQPRDPRWTMVVFGEIKPYKGLDLLLDALALLTPQQRAACRVIVAGRPRMDLGSLQQQAQRLGVADAVEWRAHRHSEQEMADLFHRTDCFVFPYRQIDASGVYFLVKSLRRWLVASEVGIFAQSIRPGRDGQLVPPGDAQALAIALGAAIEQRPVAEALPAADSWGAIGARTAQLYAGLLAHGRSVAAST
jgi:glycosyltransferase involved in cell wall biosynthesis